MKNSHRAPFTESGSYTVADSIELTDGEGGKNVSVLMEAMRLRLG